MNQKIYSFTHWKLFIMISDLKRTFMWKIEAVDDSITVQFLDISIDITVELPVYLYVTSCLRIAAKINEYLIQTLLNAESEINMINCKIIEICNILIYCEVTFKMKTADLRKAFFYNCTENIKVNVTDIISTFFIFVVKRVENELILEHF